LKFAISQMVDPGAGLLDRIRTLSERSFHAPPWSTVGIEPCCIDEMLRLPSSFLFVAWHRESWQLAGFSIGVVLSPISRNFLGLRFDTEPSLRQPLPMDGDYHLTWRAVEPRYRGFGVGQSLTQVRIQAARNLRCSNVFGETILSNHGTAMMHHHMDFEVYHRSQHCGCRGIYERLFFRKRLSSIHATRCFSRKVDSNLQTVTSRES